VVVAGASPVAAATKSRTWRIAILQFQFLPPESFDFCWLVRNLGQPLADAIPYGRTLVHTSPLGRECFRDLHRGQFHVSLRGLLLGRLRSDEIDATICSRQALRRLRRSTRMGLTVRHRILQEIDPSELSACRPQKRRLPRSDQEGRGGGHDCCKHCSGFIRLAERFSTIRAPHKVRRCILSKISEFYKPPRNLIWKSVNQAATIPELISPPWQLDRVQPDCQSDLSRPLQTS
jgi:hypothetical protein